jgi:hypothetical protein
MTMTTMTYEAIDSSIHSVDWKAMTNAHALVAPTQSERVKMIATAWRGIRPLAMVVLHLPIIKPGWHFAAEAFVGLLDGLATDVGANPDFKAGKDL